MKKFYFFVLSAMLSMTALAETDGSYYWFYDVVEAQPTGKGLVYVSNDGAEPQDDSDYAASMEFKTYDQMAFALMNVWAKPADGYQLAGWFSTTADEATFSDLVDKGESAPAPITVLTEQVSEDATVDGYGFIPDATYYALFTKVKVQMLAGMNKIASVNISKIANDTGDEITISAVPADESVTFDYWMNAKGDKITENPYTFTVGDMDTYTAYFSSDNIKAVDFGEGKFIPFSNALTSDLNSDIKVWRITPMEQGFYDKELGQYISYDESQNAWGYWEDIYQDGEYVSSEFHEYKGVVPVKDSSYELSSPAYAFYGATEGVLLYSKGVQHIVFYEEENPSVLFESFLKGTSDGPVNIGDLPVEDGDGNAMAYYIFDGEDFVKATVGTVAQNECYLALDATQFPLPERIVVASSDAVGVEGVKTETTPVLMGIYTINGQKVKAPVKGLNIIGGKKVLVP